MLDFFRLGFLAAAFLADFLRLAGLRADFFLLAFFLPAFFRLGFFLLAFFRPGFFLLVFFRLTFFLLAFFLLGLFAGFFRDAAFFLLARFFDVDFFRVTLRLLAAFLFFEVAFFAVAFLREVLAVFRFLLAALRAGIFDSCRTEKRRGLYMAGRRMEANFPVESRCPGSEARPGDEVPAGRRFQRHVSFSGDNRFMQEITLNYAEFSGSGHNSTACDSAR